MQKYWGCAEQYEGDFEAHLVREAALEAMRLEEGEQPHVMSVEERRDSKTTYYQEKKNFLHQKKPHPGRKYQYEIYGVPRKHIRPGEEGPGQDWLIIDLVRNLSNLSTQFREELGTVFWTSTSISARFTSGKPLLHFFKERPAIHQGMKSLCLKFDFWETLTKFDRTALQSLCNYLSSILNPQHLDIDITVYDTDLPRLASGKGRYKALNALRTLKVSKSFEIELCVMCVEPFGDDEDARYEHTSKLEDKHMPALRDLMIPDTLLPAPPKAEKRYTSIPRQRVCLRLLKIEIWPKGTVSERIIVKLHLCHSTHFNFSAEISTFKASNLKRQVSTSQPSQPQWSLAVFRPASISNSHSQYLRRLNLETPPQHSKKIQSQKKYIQSSQ